MEVNVKSVFIVIVIFVAALSFVFHRQLRWSRTTSITVRAPAPSRGDPCDLDPLTSLQHDPDPVFESNMKYLRSYFSKEGYVTQGGTVRREKADPLELPLFRRPPTTNSLCLPEERNSTMHVINPRDQYTVGDRVQFRVDLYTGYRTPRHFGGDDVRLWLKSATGNSSVVAKVTDFNNGSYLGEAVLKWPGVTLVRVSLTHPQEYLRALSEMFHTIHTIRWNTDFFDNGKGDKEKTVCFPFHPIPGFPNACNLTSQNGDRSWFCSRPQKKGVECRHWSKNRNMEYQSIDTTPIASVVKPFIKKFKRCCSQPDVSLRLIPNHIKLRVAQGRQKQSPVLPPCWSRPRRVTWQSSAHTGWMDKGAWLSDTCSLPTLTTEFVKDCMRNTTLILLGDSNQKLWFELVMKFIPCGLYKQRGPWHAPRLCKNFSLNSTLMYMSHAMPFSVGTHSDLVTVPLPRALGTLLQHATPGGKAVLVLHYYRHFVAFSVHVYRQRVREARKTLEQFVQLHPNVTIIIRGPHAVYQTFTRLTLIGDANVPLMTRIWKEEMVGLEDKVWLLDLWDLTVAAENLYLHPVRPTAREMIKVMFGHMCQGQY